MRIQCRAVRTSSVYVVRTQWVDLFCYLPGTIVNQVCRARRLGAPVTVNNRLVGMIHGAFTEDLPTCIV